jgi:hypothetical protein
MYILLFSYYNLLNQLYDARLYSLEPSDFILG